MSNTIENVQAAVVGFARERNWQRFHDPKNLTMALAAEVGELSAVLRWVGSGDADSALRDASIAQRFRHEVADIAIVLLLLCERTGIELAHAITEKLAINAVNYPIDISYDRADRP